MLAGRKLLIADDSPYYRTVIGLTFTDEGMEVVTADHGRQALEITEQYTPDVIIASVSTPEVSGYELCRLIKQSERLRHIPVMLLVGTHEHFDPAEARRVGADDVVTKPFKSIRELVGRVGSLLGGEKADAEGSGHGYSTLGLDLAERSEPFHPAPETEPSADPAATADEHNMTDVKVFVEAPVTAEHEPFEPAPEPAGNTCAADVALQTADTQKLERIDDEREPEAPISYDQADTMEMKPVVPELKPAGHEMEAEVQAEANPDTPADVAPDTSSIGTIEMNEQPASQTAALPTAAGLNEGLLDLGDFDRPTQFAVDEDLVLDLDYEEPAGVAVIPEVIPEEVAEAAPVFAAAPAEAVATEPEIPIEPVSTHEEQQTANLQEWAIVAEAPAVAAPVSSAEDQKASESDLALSPAVIDAIARRAVELLSEKVVHEIAWEVVPELAELLIRKKLEEQK